MDCLEFRRRLGADIIRTRRGFGYYIEESA